MKIEIPTECPSCGQTLIRVNDQLFCKNPECEEVLIKKVLNFASVMEIKGLGEKTIEKLEISDITDIYLLEIEDMQSVIGEKLAVKLYEEIQKSRKTTLETLLTAFSIPSIGKESANKLSGVVDSIPNITKDICVKAGIGEKSTDKLLEWIKHTYPKYKDLPITFEDKSVSNYSMTVCISGKLTSFTTKKEAEVWLNSKGILVIPDVTKKVDYLIKEDDKHSSKEDKAIKYDIPIITINDLKEIL